MLNALTKTATAYLPVRRRATGIAVGSAAQFLGAIVAFVMGPALEGRHRVTLLLVVQAAITSGCLVVLAAGLRRTPADEGEAAGIAGCGGIAPLVERRGAERTYLTTAVLLVTGFVAALAFTHASVAADSR